MKRLLLSLTAGALAFSTVACDEDTDGGTTAAEIQAELAQYKPTLTVTTSTIVSTYKELMDRATDLKTAVDAIKDEDSLEAAQQAWRVARVPWEQSEAFLWGPVNTMGLDPRLDSWPVAFSDMEDQISGTAELTAENLDGMYAGNLRGFHTIEYLLFGDVAGGDPREYADFTATPADDPDHGARTLLYLQVITEVLVNDSTKLWRAWSPASACEGKSDEDQELRGTCDDYAATFINGSNAYYSTKDAMSTLVAGMLDIITEVGEEKIASPYNAADVTKVESQFSYNSLADFQDNLRSVQHIYQGSEGAENTMSSVVAAQDAELDTRVKTLIADSITAVAAISEDGHPFRYYVLNAKKNLDNGRVTAAVEKIAELQKAMDEEVGALF